MQVLQKEGVQLLGAARNELVTVLKLRKKRRMRVDRSPWGLRMVNML